MSVTSENVTAELGLEISAGRRPARRRQARRAPDAFSFSPVRRLEAVRRVLVEAMTRARPRRLVLELPEYTLSFATPAEFEFALASRTEFPVRKVRALAHRSADALQVMASNIRQVEKCFADVLAHALREPESISTLLAGISIKLFTKDHQWRDLAEALNELGPAYDVYKRIALVKYLQYLGCRQDVLRCLYLDRLRADLEAERLAGLTTAEASVEPARDEPDQARPPAHHAIRTPVGITRSATPDTELVSPRDTAIFHLEKIALEGDTEGFGLLPRGETIEVAIPAGECLELHLSSYRLKLHAGQRYRLTDEDGNIHVLPTGKSVVGRHHAADIVVDSDNRTISRKHLMLEPVAADRVRLTDLSSHGTSVPLQFLKASAAEES